MRALFVPLLMVASAVAQEYPTKGPATHDPTKNSSQPNTYEGCITRSNGELMLNSVLNHQFKLTSARSLDSYVGQEVRIVAHNVNPNDPSSDERSMSAGESENTPETLAVEEIQKVSDKCQANK